MRVKAYQAGEIGEALDKIKQDLGPDAVILSTQRIQPHTGEWGGPIIEVMAGLSSDDTQTGLHFFQIHSPGVPRVRLREPEMAYEGPTSVKIELEQLLSPRLDDIEAVYALVDDDLIEEMESESPGVIDPAVLAVLNEQLGVVGSPPTTDQFPVVEGSKARATPDFLPAQVVPAASLHSSSAVPAPMAPMAPMAPIGSSAHCSSAAPTRTRIASPPPVPKAARRAGAGAYRRGGHSNMFQRTGSAVIPGVVLADPAESFAGDPMKELDQWLSDANVASVHRTPLVEGVRSRMVSARPSRDLVERSFIEEIAGRVEFRPQADLDNRRMVAFVGPTGVGKTTTLAKLAAEYTLQQQRSVGLLTIDTHRVGGVDQIARYAGLLEIPLEVVSDRADLERALRRLENCDKVLVDTIGRSPRDMRPAREVREIFEGVPGISYELCLSATTSLQDMRGILESYAEIVPENLLFTKLDEAFALGPLVGAHLEEMLPLSYFTTGQRVPEDIERASIERIIGMMIPFE